jgi:hypothetical protein
MRVRLRRLLLLAVGLLVIAAVTIPIWKPVAKRFKWFVVATNIYQDTLRRTGLRTDQISQPDFSTLPDNEIPEYLSRINNTFADYEHYGELNANAMRGAHVLEVGPGETLGVALRFSALGASLVTAIDKFVPLQTSTFHQHLYKQLIGSMSPAEQQRVADAVSLSDGVTFNPKRIQYIYGEGVEDAGLRLPQNSYDAIVSNAVLEEVYDLDRMFDVLDGLLKPGGRQVHVVDLRDYGMFTKHGFHPLEFLTIPDGVYRYMVESTGQPNRRRVDYYRGKLASLGYETQIYPTWVVGGTSRFKEYPRNLELGRDYTRENLELVKAIRPRLLPRYQQLSDDDLLTASILVVATKRSGPTSVQADAGR